MGRKGQAYRLFAPTPLSELTTEGMSLAQVWEQVEVRNAKMCALLDTVVVQEQNDEEESGKEEDVLDEVDKTKRRKGVRLGDDDEEQVVRSLQDLNDADLRSLGLDPRRRAQLAAMEEEHGWEDEEDDEEEESDEEEEGYAGASDLSDSDEYSGKVVKEPLMSEKQQMKNKAAAEARERRRMRSQARIAQMMGQDDDQEEEEEDEEEDEEEGEEEDEEHEEDQEEEQDAAPTSILDSLDAPGTSSSSSGRKGKRHPELDDEFFSIDQFNADTDDYGDEGIDLGEDVDLFKPVGGDDEEEEEEEDEEGEEQPIYYADFFAPPPFQRKGKARPSDRRLSSKADQKTVHPAATGTQDATPQRKRSVRFHDEVAVRRIKPRKEKELDIMPAMLQQWMKEDKDSDEDDEEDEEEEEGEEEGGDDDQEQHSDGSSQEEEEEEAEMDVDSDSGVSEKEEGDFVEDEEEATADRETAQRVVGDLFADDENDDEDEGNHSSHEKRLLALQQEIRRLEEENVAQKDWTLMGEAGTRARPENSLLEEEMEFENSAKAKPIVTPETTSSLEDVIKKRILASQFDDVQRRATLQPMDFLPSKLLELSDVKSSKSLDQVYEEEMGLGAGSDAPGARLDKELQREHEEIDGLYDSLERQLDALSNAHYTPKAPKVSIQTVSNAPAITLEESMPPTVSHASQLAPEEVYDAGGRHNVALEGASSELTPEEKKRRHRQVRQEKRSRNERMAAHRRNVEIHQDAFGQHRGGRFVRGQGAQRGHAAQEKEAALQKLMGNKGVSVVGKGQKASKPARHEQASKAPLHASHLKL